MGVRDNSDVMGDGNGSNITGIVMSWEPVTHGTRISVKSCSDGMEDIEQGYDNTGQCSDNISWDEAGICVTSSCQSPQIEQEDVGMDVSGASGDWEATLSVRVRVRVLLTVASF